MANKEEELKVCLNPLGKTFHITRFYRTYVFRNAKDEMSRYKYLVKLSPNRTANDDFFAVENETS